MSLAPVHISGVSIQKHTSQSLKAGAEVEENYTNGTPASNLLLPIPPEMFSRDIEKLLPQTSCKTLKIQFGIWSIPIFVGKGLTTAC